MKTNPFYELYLAETMSASEFVTLFSPLLIPHVQPLFLPGNVVVVGMQGSGKSMLLTLLKTETRLKYEQVRGEFPVPPERRKFISCSVNLTHSNATDFGYRDWLDDDPREVEMMFGDFVNALLVSDLFSSLDHFINASARIRQEAGLDISRPILNQLASLIASQSIWNGWLGNVKDWKGLEARLNERITEYRGYLHRRKKSISQDVISTKTSIGEPIGEIADLMRKTGVIQKSTNVFVDIDQYEELGNIRVAQHPLGTIDYRSVVNRAISRRDPRVSYRIGSRRHSWRNHSKILGSDGKLEEERDYKFVDLDILLKRSENPSTYIFPRFAEDVFTRRMDAAGISRNGDRLKPSDIYGSSETPVQKAEGYTFKASEMSHVRPKTRARLQELASSDPFSAKLLDAWLRQKGDHDPHPIAKDALPWEAKPYWRKERAEMALFQLVSANQQRVYYSGAEEIYDLSNGNILIFISINQHIWGHYLRFVSTKGDISQVDRIGRDQQTAGIYDASDHWYDKIREEPGRSSERKQFVDEFARFVKEAIIADRKMSYPGANGFSLKDSDLKQFPEMRAVLEELADYGTLTMSAHTTKEKDRAARFKWYISPIYCPHLRIPYKRTKEPYYSSIKEVAGWLAKAGFKVTAPVPDATAQGKLL